MAISFITVAYPKNDHTGVSKTGLPLFRYCTVADPDLQMTWGCSSTPWDKGGWGGGALSKKNFLAVHSHFRSHYLGKFSHLTLKLSSVYLQHSFLSGYFRVCKGTITSTLGAYSHLWIKGKRVRFSNFQLKMFKNWQISLCYWWW